MEKNFYDILVKYLVENQQKFYRLAYCYVKNPDSAMDVVQNAICKVLENYGSLKNPDALKTWIYRIVINESLNYLKKNGRELAWEPETIPQELYEEPAYQEDREVFEAVQTLPENLKLILILHFYEDLTLKEVARVTGVNENTVKTRMYSALGKLRKQLGEGEECI